MREIMCYYIIEVIVPIIGKIKTVGILISSIAHPLADVLADVVSYY